MSKHPSVAPVSVIIPCYRCEQTVKRAVRSVVMQTWRPAELFLIDDASGDNTLTTLFRLQTEYGADWIKVIARKENGGPAAARNMGWEMATQPYLAFLDADDSWHPRKIEIQLGFMLKNPDLTITGHKWLVVDSEYNSEVYSVLPAHFNAHLVNFRRLLFSNVFCTPTVILRRDIPYRFDERKRYSEDYLLWLQILASGFKGAVLDLPLAYLYKPPYGYSGMSKRLWKMELGEINNYWQLYRKGHLSCLFMCGLVVFSLCKFARRIAKTMMRSC